MAQEDVGELDNLAALNNLASELSAAASVREGIPEQRSSPEVITPWTPTQPARRPRVVAAALTVLLVVAVAGSVALLVKTLHTGAVRPAPATVVPKASTTLAGQLGAAARQKLLAGGVTPGAGQCQSAYAADAAASPLVLPAASNSPQRSAYIAGCLARR